MALKLSRRSDIPVFRVLDILKTVSERVAQGEDIVHFEYGQPSSGAPQPALDYGAELLKSDSLGYTVATGLPALKERIAQWYHERYQVTIKPDQVVISIGASGAFILNFLALFDVGDRVAMAAPGYPAYRNILMAMDLRPVEIESKLENDYQPTIAELEALDPKPDGLIIGNPSNPTGTMLSRQRLKDICEWCKTNQVRLIMDELYHGITFEEDAETALKYTDEAIIVNSFSKYFSMTGWRLGWSILPADVQPRVKRLAESLFVSPPALSQHIALKAMDCTDILDGYVAHYHENLNMLRSALPQAGITHFAHTKGAFYLYADISPLSDNSIQWCERALDEAKIAITPGLDFDLTRGLQTIRLSFAGSRSDIEKGCARLIDWNTSS